MKLEITAQQNGQFTLQIKFELTDNTMISPALQAIFERVRDGADFMPSWQLEVHMNRLEYGSSH